MLFFFFSCRLQKRVQADNKIIQETEAECAAVTKEISALQDQLRIKENEVKEREVCDDEDQDQDQDDDDDDDDDEEEEEEKEKAEEEEADL